jgi:hypothetical protein
VDLLRRAGGYVHRILHGAKPADLPVEKPTRLKQVINLKAAKTLGLTIQPSLLVTSNEAPMSLLGTFGHANCIARCPLPGQSGKHMLSFSGFYPTRTSAWIIAGTRLGDPRILTERGATRGPIHHAHPK